MTRRLALVGLLVGFALVAGPPAALAGGCHGTGDVTEGTGTTVEIERCGFSPSVIRVEPGSEVTFVNHDPLAHNITGTAIEYAELKPEQSVLRRFDDVGTYAYACTLHNGMTGTVVVGDGVAGTATPVTELAAQATRAATDASNAWPIATVVLALLLAVGSYLAGRRTITRP